MIAAVVLAAGRAVRMGAPKMLLPLAGRTLLAHVIAAAQASQCEAVFVVAGAHAEVVRREAEALGAQLVFNPHYDEGMGTSLAAGIAALPAECEAAVVLLGDQPRVSGAAIDRLIAAYRETRKPIVVSRYGEVAGAPTLIARALFADAVTLTGDVGGRVLATRYPDRVAQVSLGVEEAWDVDTPEDLARLRRAVEEG